MSQVPNEAKFIKPVNFNGVVKERRTTRISPLNGSQFGTGQIDRINFAIPAQSNYAIDMNTFMLHFKAEVSGSGNWSATDTNTTHLVYFNNSIESIIDELIIKKGSSGQYLEDIKNYNYLDSIFMNFVSADFNLCPGKALLGIGSPLDRVKLQNIITSASANSATDPFTGLVATSRKAARYCLPFRLSGLSNYGGILPSQIIDQVNSFTIEIILANAANCLQCWSTTNLGQALSTAGYKLSEVYLTYDVVRMSDDYYDNLYSSINSGIPIEIPYKSWRVSTFSLSQGTQNVAFNINETFKSLNAIYVAFFRQDEQNDFRIAGRDRLHFPNLKSYQLQINNMYYPLQPVECQDGAPEAFLELLKSLGDGYLNGEPNGPFNFDGSDYTRPSVTFKDTNAGGTGAAAGAVSNITNIGNLFGKQVDLFTTSANAAANDGNAWLGANITTNAQVVGATASGTAANIGAVSGRAFMLNACGQSPSNFVLGFNLRKMMNVEDGESVGENLSEGSGIMTLRLETATGGAPSNYNVLVCCNYDAVFRIEANQSTQKLE